MTTALKVTFLVVIAYAGIEALLDALRFSVRQDFYRVRDRLYDRAMMGEIDLETPSVQALTRYLHLFVRTAPYFSSFLILRIFLARSQAHPRVVWLYDPDIRQEAASATKLTFRALALIGPLCLLGFALLRMLKMCCGWYKKLTLGIQRQGDKLLKKIIVSVEADGEEESTIPWRLKHAN